MLRLDLRHDRDEQTIARTEVVDQHAMARARVGREIAQRSRAEAVARDRLDHCLEERGARLILGDGHAVWRVSQRRFRPAASMRK